MYLCKKNMCMEDLVLNIYELIKDYRQDDGVRILPDDICAWGRQFGEDAEFMLSELAHLLPQIYFSKERVRKELRNMLNELYRYLKYSSVSSFFEDVEFLCLQPEGKSQRILLQMIDDVAVEKTSRSLSEYARFTKKVFVYVDDVLASGGTIGKDLVKWLERDGHLADIVSRKTHLVVSLLCSHSWGRSFVDYRLRKTFPELKGDLITWGWAYEIQNHLKWANQSLNIAIPVKDQPEDVKNYLSTLTAMKYEEYAYREINNPIKETFFTSPENRIRYENNLLKKGLEIISKIENPSDGLRPLGMVNPAYRTFGLGTHFFTWRNIPNNSPLVFWWDVPEHGWKPLFKPKRN